MARRERKTAGRVVSELGRRGLTEAKDPISKKVPAKEVFLGFRPFPGRGAIVTNEVIDWFREGPRLKRALLDINVLIALLDLDHVHQRKARNWLQREAASGWEACPLTENGCVRMMSQAKYPNPVPAAEVIKRRRLRTTNLARRSNHSGPNYRR